MRIATFLLLASFFCCSSVSTNNELINSTLTSEGLGKYKLGSSFSNLVDNFPAGELFNTGTEGFFWNGLKIDLNNGEWVIFENGSGNFLWDASPFDKSLELDNPNFLHYSKSEQNNIIRVIRTNSKRINTNANVRVGMTIDEVQDMNIDIDIFSDLSRLNLQLTDFGIVFRVSEHWEQVYFDDGGEFPTNLNIKSTISEIKIQEN